MSMSCFISRIFIFFDRSDKPGWMDSVRQEMDSIQPSSSSICTHVECVNGQIRSGQCRQWRYAAVWEFYPAGCWVCWVSVERSAAAAWPRSHSSQAGGIDRPVIKSGALVGLCAAHCSPSKARGCCLLSPICIIQRHRSSRRKGPHSGILLPLFCFANFQLK